MVVVSLHSYRNLRQSIRFDLQGPSVLCNFSKSTSSHILRLPYAFAKFEKMKYFDCSCDFYLFPLRLFRFHNPHVAQLV